MAAAGNFLLNGSETFDDFSRREPTHGDPEKRDP